jgi:hypothetical protein
MFRTDGSVHYGGVQNEADTIQILNELNIYNCVVEKLGGTTQKADATTADKLISIKRKKGISNGSFDWFNTSKYNESLGNIFDSFLESVKQFRTFPKSILNDIEFISTVRNQFNQLCETCLDNLTDSQIRNIIQQGLCDTNNNFDVVINDIETHRLMIFPFENHPVVQYLSSGMSISLEGTGKSSRKIIFSDGQNNYDCGLRIRVTSNNGINAFLGLSKANKSSQVVIKLQQDSIHKLLAQTEHKTYEY